MNPSPTGTPLIPPKYVPYVAILLTAVNGLLVTLQQQSSSPSVKLACTIALATLAPVIALFSPGLRKGDGAQAVAQAGKVLLVVLGLGMLLVSSPARASGIDWSAGPSVPFLEYDFHGAHPVSIAPGAGVQLSITHDSLKRAFFGKSWDLVDLQLAGFGSVLSKTSGEQFGALSAMVGVSFLSSLVSVGVGKHVLSADQSFTAGGWFLALALNFNFALSPQAPPTGIEQGAAGLPRANTLYFGSP